MAVHAFVSLVSMSFSVDSTLLPRYVNLSTSLSGADYADDIAILANTPDQAETLLHSLERAAASIGLYVNAHKTEFDYITIIKLYIYTYIYWINIDAMNKDERRLL